MLVLVPWACDPHKQAGHSELELELYRTPAHLNTILFFSGILLKVIEIIVSYPEHTPPLMQLVACRRLLFRSLRCFHQNRSFYRDIKWGGVWEWLGQGAWKFWC